MTIEARASRTSPTDILAEPWPPDVISRDLTVGWATVDVYRAVTPAVKGGPESHRLSVVCMGEGCDFIRGYAAGQEGAYTFTVMPGEDLRGALRSTIYELKRMAAVHAEQCRKIRRPAV